MNVVKTVAWLIGSFHGPEAPFEVVLSKPSRSNKLVSAITWPVVKEFIKKKVEESNRKYLLGHKYQVVEASRRRTEFNIPLFQMTNK